MSKLRANNKAFGIKILKPLTVGFLIIFFKVLMLRG